MPLDAETLRVLTPAIVLLTLLMGMGTAWIKDRNARIRDLKEQLEMERREKLDWREAHRLSELAREKNDETVREALTIARTSEAVISGLRTALAQLRGDDG